MNLHEQRAVLLLAERIAAGENFHDGMTVSVGKQQVNVTSAMVESAAKIALARNRQGFAAGTVEAPTGFEEPKKGGAKP